MKVKDIVDHFGSKAKAAKALGIGRANLTHWEANDHIPEKQAMKLDKLTNGELAYKPSDYNSEQN
ncbi:MULTISPECIES: Cro/CI family transcriptional regulator [unclassified Vibrio]|uniref:Cro/CI family transcriptional regulator n=1 Tax=unclassified Vibrio TaxID=2614977 RepID=UPI001A90AE10|nr:MULTISPECIES: Cro/CI family transcriptional regulator [unclassified Vibrio]MBO0137383.1 hypothetical protein [Vibrio sp. Vb2736]MDW1948752.1 Cro/CI family transcriptional regulator [Vibrio sp. 812(2023)]MDW1991332.1 Cro/CI family transcriptional regulator [Vibrio sp. 780]